MMKTILTFAIFAALLAIPQFTNKTAFAHQTWGNSAGATPQIACTQASWNALSIHVPHGGYFHQTLVYPVQVGVNLWTCSATFG